MINIRFHFNHTRFVFLNFQHYFKTVIVFLVLFGYHKGQCFDNSEVYILSITYLSLLKVFNSVTGMSYNGHGTSFR